jgi:hypothetical protein
MLGVLGRASRLGSGCYWCVGGDGAVEHDLIWEGVWCSFCDYGVIRGWVGDIFRRVAVDH